MCVTSTHDPQVMPSILSSHFSDVLLSSLPLTNGSSSLRGSTSLPNDADNGVLDNIFVKTDDIADMIQLVIVVGVCVPRRNRPKSLSPDSGLIVERQRKDLRQIAEENEGSRQCRRREEEEM